MLDRIRRKCRAGAGADEQIASGDVFIVLFHGSRPDDTDSKLALLDFADLQRDYPIFSYITVDVNNEDSKVSTLSPVPPVLAVALSA